MAAKAITLQDLYTKLEAFQNEVRSEFKSLGVGQRELFLAVNFLATEQQSISKDLADFRQYTESGFETMLTRFDWLEDRFDRFEERNGNYEH
jgi:hypothetical protein